MEYLRFALNVARLRLGYIKTGDVGPLARALCAACPCGDEQRHILDQLKNTLDFDGRVTRSFASWPNEMLKCYRAHTGRYPVEAWEQFKTQFGIRESHREKGPE